jgi:hypothetical protein
MIDKDGIEQHPVQTSGLSRWRGYAPKIVTMRAYEVYKEVHGEQEALVTGECRGGFGVSELIAFLYAHSFPKNEWRTRCDEAFRGLDLKGRG